MSGQKNNQHPFGSTCCRKTYGLDGKGMNPRIGLEWIECKGLDGDLNGMDWIG